MDDWYPKASRSQTWPTDGRAYTSGYAWKLALHSTEGTSWPSYDGGSVAPHFTANPRTGDVRQHYPISYPAKALYQPSSPSTNKGKAVQIEIIGTCDPSRKNNSSWKGWFLPDFAPADFKGLPDLLAWIAAQTGLRLSRGVDFRAYPSSYGAPTGRLSSSAWKSYNQVCGHQHVPDNNHGDPGNIDIDGLLALAAGGAPPKPQPPAHREIDMIYCTSSDGRGWLVGVGVKTLINTPATRDKLLAAGVPNAGTWSGDVLNEFTTWEGAFDQVNDKLNTIVDQTK